MTGDRWRTDLTVSTEVVYESPFAICEVHAVRSEDGSKVMEDWLWMEEINHVNVVVFEKKTQEFIFFRQGKYGLREDSLAVVGGLQEQGESGLETSRREVREELGMVSQNEFTAIQAGEEEAFDATSDENWVSFGQYRCAVNRGGGWVSVFLLLDAVAIDENGGTNDFGQVAQNSGTAFETTATGKAEADGEAQAVVRMNTQQARRALMQGEFKEIKWSAALAFALLHIEDNGL